MIDQNKARKALEALVYTINATGGVEHSKGFKDLVPTVDKAWGDLGEAYRLACEALDRPMKFADETPLRAFIREATEEEEE